MTVELDHLLFGAADLDVGVAAVVAATGFAPSPGGVHPGLGSRNSLVGLGGTYLEVIAPDPAQTTGAMRDRVLALPRPELFTWCVRTTDMDATAERLRGAGLVVEPFAMSRTTPDGLELHWRLAFVEGHDLGGVVPTVIDWLDTPHPSSRLAAQGEVEDLVVEHPEQAEVRRVLDVLELDVPAVVAARPGIVARLRTDDGTIELR